MWLHYLLLITGIALFLIGNARCWTAARSTTWRSVPGRITVSRLHRFKTVGDPEAFAWEIRYRYEVGGKEFIGSNVSFKPQWRVESRSYMESLREKYPPEAEIQVYKHPVHPSRSVLEPGLDWSLSILPAIGALIAALSFLVNSA